MAEKVKITVEVKTDRSQSPRHCLYVGEEGHGSQGIPRFRSLFAANQAARYIAQCYRDDGFDVKLTTIFPKRRTK